MNASRPHDDIDRLRAEVAEWRRRAEVAEAVSAERLARAETAERALEAIRTRPSADLAGAPERADAQAGPPPRSMRERWRRYIESVN